MKKDFNEFRFGGLDLKDISNKYYTMNRVSEDETKIVVKVAKTQLFQTIYGSYGLILDDKKVVFVKSWQVSDNYFGCEVLLTKEYFNVKEFGNRTDFGINEENYNWETWLNVAKEQAKANNIVRWEK